MQIKSGLPYGQDALERRSLEFSREVDEELEYHQAKRESHEHRYKNLPRHFSGVSRLYNSFMILYHAKMEEMISGEYL